MRFIVVFIIAWICSSTCHGQYQENTFQGAIKSLTAPFANPQGPPPYVTSVPAAALPITLKYLPISHPYPTGGFYYAFISNGPPIPNALFGPAGDVFNVDLSNLLGIVSQGFMSPFVDSFDICIPLGIPPGANYTLQAFYYNPILPDFYAFSGVVTMTII